MTIELNKNNGDLLIALTGRLDSTTAGDLEEAFKAELNDSIRSLTVDLEKVDFISSKGLRVLVGAYKTLRGKDVILTGANTSVTELLRLSGLDKVFKIV